MAYYCWNIHDGVGGPVVAQVGAYALDEYDARRVATSLNGEYTGFRWHWRFVGKTS